MAITLVGSGNDRLDFGDVAAFAELTGFSIFLIHKPSSLTNDARLAGQWSDNFLFAIQDSDEVGLVVKETTGPAFFGKKTTDLNMTTGNEYRILVTVAFGSPPTIHIYVNGVDRTVAEFVGSGNVPDMSEAAQAFQVGHETSSSTDGNDGDYAELAIWSRALSGAEATVLTSDNKLPTCVDATGRLIYLPMANTSDLTDQWSAITASLTGGSNATHPTMVDCGADKAIWELDALTTPIAADLLAIVDDPSGTPATKKMALSSLIATLLVSNVVVQVKTVGSGTYTPTTGMKKVLVIGVGGGGAGAGGVNTDSAGGGGGGGGTCIRLLTAAQIGASKAYVVGAAGAATTLDAAGALINAGAGGNGTAGAQSAALGGTAAGGTGGTAANGDLNIPGSPGATGTTYSGTDGMGGTGGSSVFGFGAASAGTNVAGSVGQAYGGGGSGGHAGGASDRAGAAGADGILYFLEFLAA